MRYLSLILVVISTSLFSMHHEKLDVIVFAIDLEIIDGQKNPHCRTRLKSPHGNDDKMDNIKAAPHKAAAKTRLKKMKKMASLFLSPRQRKHCFFVIISKSHCHLS